MAAAGLPAERFVSKRDAWLAAVLWLASLAFYALGIGLLCLHLSHGVSSMFQSVGWKNDAYRPWLDKLAYAIGILIFLGYLSIPLAILLGYGKEALK